MRLSNLIIFYVICAIRGAFASKIIFPEIDDFPLQCTFNNGSEGICMDIKYCPAAWTAPYSEVKTCCFMGSDQFVCCKFDKMEDKNLDLKEITERIAVKKCNQFYPRVSDIVHGTRTEPWEFYYMAALGWKSNASNITDYRCGGVLISRDFVLTAAHCTDINGDPPSVIVLGGVNLSENNYTQYEVIEVITHPSYDPEFSYNDIALIKIQEEKKFFYPVACLWVSSTENVSTVTAIGYGHTRFGGAPSPHLLKADLSIIPNKDCQNFYTDEDNLPKGIVDQHICAKDPENKRDTCQGDSGGPLITKVQVRSRKRPYVVGITSVGHGCAGQPPSVYIRVSEYTEWIETIVWSNKDDDNSDDSLEI